MTKGELKEIIREIVKAELAEKSESKVDESNGNDTASSQTSDDAATKTADADDEKASEEKASEEKVEEEKVEEALTEGVTGPGYVIKAWDNPELKSGAPSFDSEEDGKLYPDFDDVLVALNSGDLDGLGAYEITWIQSGKETE